MQAPQFKRLNRSDIPDAPDWVDPLLNNLNNYLQTITIALSGNLDFATNIRGKILSVSFITPSTYSSGVTTDFNPINFKVGFSPVNCVSLGNLVKKADNFEVLIKPSSVNWQQSSETNIRINYISGLEPLTTYTATFLLI